MKHTIKTVIYLLTFIAIFVMSSCERNLYDDKIYQSKIKVEKVSLKDNSKFKTKINPKLYKAVAKIKNVKHKLTNKMVFDSIDNIYYDDETGIKITKDDYESYTFKIINEGGKLENLVFSKNNLGDFDMFKIKYNYTEDEIKQFSEAESIQKLKEFTYLNLQTNLQKYMGPCIYELDDDDDDGGIMAPRFFKMVYIIDVTCFGSMLGGGGDGNGNGNPDNPTNTGSNNSGSNGHTINGGVSSNQTGNSNSSADSTVSNPIMTTPIHGMHPTPCLKMKELLKDENLRARLTNLKVATDQYSFEQLYVVNPNPIPTTNNNYQYVLFSGNSSNGEANWKGDSTMKGLLHSHYDSDLLLSIFSPTDLQTLYYIMSSPTVTDDFFYGVTTKAGTRYMITIENRSAFLAFGDKYLNSDSKAKDFDTDVWQGKYNIQVGNGMGNHNELAFTKMMKDLNMGVNLFSLGADFTTSEQLKYKTINSVVGDVDKTNCN